MEVNLTSKIDRIVSLSYIFVSYRITSRAIDANDGLQYDDESELGANPPHQSDRPF
jgi:hypothetical protein